MTPPTSLNATSSPGLSHQSALRQTSSPTSAPLLHNSSAPPDLTLSVNPTKSAKTGCKVSRNSPTSFSNQNGQHSALTSSPPAPQQGSIVQTGPEIPGPSKGALSPSFGVTPHPTSASSASHVSAEVCERIKEILHRCSHGLWASALPKLYVDTYKMPFPEHILDNLSLLLNICIVEYPLSHDKTKVSCQVDRKLDLDEAFPQAVTSCNYPFCLLRICAFRQSFTPARQMRRKKSSARTRLFPLGWRCRLLCCLPVWLVPRCSTPLC